MKNAYYGVPAVQSYAFGGIANPTQRATLRSSDKEYLDARQKELDEFEKQRTAYNDSLAKWQTEVYNPYKSQVEAYNTGAQKYNTDVYEPYKKQFDDYVKAVETWNAGDRTTDYAGPAEPKLTKAFDLTAPVTPEDFKMAAPVVPFKEEEVVARQKEAAARATQDAGNRAVAIDVVSDPDRFNFGAMSVSNRFMAEGGEVKSLADDVAAAGRGGDELLAYLSPEALRLLKENGGSGTINPETGLPEFFVNDAINSVFGAPAGKGIPKVLKVVNPNAAQEADAAAKAAAAKAAADAKELAAFRAKEAAVDARWTSGSQSKPATTTAAVDLDTAIRQLKAGDNAAANLTMRQIVGLDPMPTAAKPIPSAPVATPGQTPTVNKNPPVATFTPAVPPRPTPPPARDPRADDAGFGIPKPPSGSFVPGAGQYGAPTSSDGKWLYSSGKWYPNETVSVPDVKPPKDEGFMDLQVTVFGPDGTMYGNPRLAREAGVTNYTYQPPKTPAVPPPRSSPIAPPSIPYTPPAMPGQVQPGMTRPGSPPAADIPISMPTMPTYSSRGVGAVGTADTLANKNYFALTPETSTGLAPGSAAIGPADMPLAGARGTLNAMGLNKNLSPTMLGGAQNAGYTTDRLGNRIYGFAKGGGVNVNALLAQNTETLSDEVPEEVINTNPVGTAQKMLADLGNLGKVSPVRQSIKRVRTAPGGGGATADKSMQMPYEGLGKGDLGAMKDVTPTAKNTDSARAQMEELARVYQIKIRAAQNKGKGLSADTFGAPTLEGPTLTKNKLTKKRFKDGGEAKKSEGELSQEEIDAASRPAFVTPRSGKGRKEGPISQQLRSGDAYINMAKGVTELPYDLAGAPVDLATMAMRPFGYSTEKPVMGSDFIKEKMTKLGVRPEPPTDPTAKGFYTAGELLSNLVNPAGVTRAGVKAAEKTGKAATEVAKDFQQYNRQLVVPGASYVSRAPGGYFPTSRGMGEKTAEEINNTKLSDLPDDFVSWLNTDDKNKSSFLGLGPKRESLGDKYNRWKAETGNKDYTFGILSGVDKSFRPVLKKITEMESGEKRDALFQMFNQKAKDFYSKQAGSIQDPLRADILGGNIKFDMDSKMGDVFPQVLVKQAAQGDLQALRLLEKNYDNMIGIKAVVPYRRVPSRPEDIAPPNTLKRQIIESVRDNLDSIPDSQLLAYASKKPLPGPDGVAKAAKEVRLKLKENPNLFSTVLEPNIERTVFARESRYSDVDMARHPSLYGTTATEAMINPQGPAITKDQFDAMETVPQGYFLPELETAISKNQPILDAHEYGDLKLLGLDPQKLLQEANRLSAKDLNSMGFTDFLKKAYKSSEEVAQLEKDLKRVKPLLQQGKLPPANVMLFGVKDFLPTVNDMRWVKVTNPDGVKSIAAGMNNSVGSYATSETYGALGRGRRALDSGEVEVYALYDKNHIPHVTVEYGTGKSSVPEKQRSQILQLTGNGPLTANESSNNYAEQIAALVNALPIKNVTALPASTQKILKNNFFEFKDNRVVRNEEEFTKNQALTKELGLAKGGLVDKNIAFIKAHT